MVLKAFAVLLNRKYDRGTPPKKHKVGGENEIGIDIGTSTIAIVSDNKV